MTPSNDFNLPGQTAAPGKILLLLLPYWTPQIPPLGISCLQGFLKQHGVEVSIADANTLLEFNELHNRYFELLTGCIPASKRKNFKNIGHEVLRHHMLAGLNRSSTGGSANYLELVKTIVFNTFYHQIGPEEVTRLDSVVTEFYLRLERYLLELLEKEKPGVLGISVFEDTVPASIFAFQWARQHNPAIKTLMGGGILAEQLAPGSPNLDYFLQKTEGVIDKIFIGESELLLLKWLKGELPQCQRVYTLEDLHSQTLDLAAAAVPDFTGLSLEFYPYLASYTARSCPYQCTFCSETVQWGKYRKKNPAQVVRELLTLYETYGSQLFFLCDSLLNPSIDGLCRELRREGAVLYWDGYLRAGKEVCNTGRTFSWRKAGYYRARLGVESGSGRVLELMNKGVSPAEIKGSVSALAHAGIKTTTYWVVGYPGETEQDFRQTLNLVEELKDDIYEAWCSPFAYYLTGQVNSAGWASRTSHRLLYPESARELLVIQTWVQDCEPSREETYRRMDRFVEHCKKLEIPNPFTLKEIHLADERWKKLHENAVPSIIEFDHHIDECKTLENLVPLRAAPKEHGDFGF